MLSIRPPFPLVRAALALSSCFSLRAGALTLDRALALAILCLSGCESLKQANRAAGILDFVMILAGSARPDIAPIEKATTGDGEIVTARAVVERGRVSVRGSVRKKFGAGWVSGAYSHVDVLVLNPKRRVAEAQTTYFFPSDIPNNLRGEEGRSSYYAALKALPAPGSVIRVVFHNIPRRQCGFYRAN